ncbi:MAG: citrate lyase holo-[acyl-carrier protein] synthase [Treponema sp.]|nr:citrate lyase holo-[acyl-carrier protein] synthase [Treponema sp.]
MTATTVDMMAARDSRAGRQKEFAARHGSALVSYTLNIIGSQKRFKSGDRAFYEGKREIEKIFARKGHTALDYILTDAHTGLECLWAVAADARDLKSAMSAIEESHPIGRLFDIDVISSGGEKIPRGALDLPERACLVCGSPGHGCARSRHHPVEEVLQFTHRIIDGYFARKDAAVISGCAMRALLYELAATPKPGLVDRRNNGAHKDMDFYTFIDSTVSLAPYFNDMAAAGIAHRNIPPGDLLAKLRQRGILAEEEMLAATGGVNAQKGIIFSMGILCAACGYLGLPLESTDDILDTAGKIAAPALQSDFQGITARNAATYGEKAFANHAAAGIRGEAAAGFPSVRAFALPALAAALARGVSLGDAGTEILLRLLANVGDTNVIGRGGLDALGEIQRDLRDFFAAQPDTAAAITYAADLDRSFIGRNISPGGCADLLAVTYMAHFVSSLN